MPLSKKRCGCDEFGVPSPHDFHGHRIERKRVRMSTNRQAVTRAAEFGDSAAQDLIVSGGQQFSLLVGAMLF